MVAISAQGATNAQRSEVHDLQCVADCGIVMPLSIGDYLSIILVAVVIASVWNVLRWLAARRKQPHSGR